jgi:hypothetical protein
MADLKRANLRRKWSTTITKIADSKQQTHDKNMLPLFEVSRVLVRFNHIACFILNANHGIM